MQENREYPKRKQIRLSNYDYASNGAYHVIICTAKKQKILSEIIPPADELSPPQINLTEVGTKAEKAIQAFSCRYSFIHISEYCIMPNHIHLMIEYGAEESSEIKSVSLSNVISRLKSTISVAAGHKLWEKSFYEHVIRDEHDYIATIKYIQDNPAKWYLDKYYL